MDAAKPAAAMQPCKQDQYPSLKQNYEDKFELDYSPGELQDLQA